MPLFLLPSHRRKAHSVRQGNLYPKPNTQVLGLHINKTKFLKLIFLNVDCPLYCKSSLLKKQRANDKKLKNL